MVDWLAGNRVRGTSTERTSTTGFNDGFTGVGGWKELARTTLGSAGDTISVTSLADKRYYMVLSNVLPTGSVNAGYRFNTDSGGNYAYRHSNDGGIDSTGTSATLMAYNSGSLSTPRFGVGYVSNVSTKEKLLLSHSVNQQTAGAGNAPSRQESVGKHAQTTNPINEIQLFNLDSGSFDTNSEVVVLGWDDTDTHTTNFWEELASVNGSATSNLSSRTITAKKYLWVQLYKKVTRTGNNNSEMTFNNDSGSNYASRENIDGGSDSTRINQTRMYIGGEGGWQNLYTLMNFFIINNSATEKLVIESAVDQQLTGASNTPHRYEMVHKWTNTSAQITEIDFDLSGGTFDSESIIKVWGSD